MKYIVDEEINLQETDYLNSKQYSNALKNIIDSAPKDKVFTVGLFGGWGTGKSSIIKTTKELYKNDDSVTFVYYDAWQYVNDSFRRMFLRTLQEDLNYSSSDFMKKFYENKSRDIKVNHKITIFNIIYIFIGLLFTFFLLRNQTWDTSNKIGLVSAWTLLSTVLTIGTKYFDCLKVSVTEPMFFAPEQFADCFKEIVTFFFNKNGIKDHFKYLVSTITGKEFHGTKLVIIIDNIDRCQGDVAYSLLSDIKTFLGNFGKNIIFLIPVDDIALKKQIFNKTLSQSDNKENEEFLRKSFNTVLRIKPFVETDMYEFAKKIVKDNDLSFNDDVIYLASKKYSKNPRRIVQLFNNLISEFSFYTDSDFVEKKQALICLCLIIREEYYDFYKLLINSPSIIKNQSLIEEDKKEILNTIKDFLLISKTIIKKFEMSDVEKVLSNTESNYVTVPENIKTSITTFNSETFLELLNKSPSLRDDALEYIIYKVTTAVGKKNKNEIGSLLTFIAETNLNENYSNILQNIDGQFIKYGYDNIIEDSTNYSAICNFIEYLSEEGFNAAKNDLVKILTNFDIEKQNINSDLFNETLKFCIDTETSEALAKTFNLIYESNSRPEKISTNQYDYMITDYFIQKRIDKISEIQFSDENLVFIMEILENKSNYESSTVNKYISKVQQILKTNQNKNYEAIHNELLNVIFVFEPLIKNYRTYKNINSDSQIQALYNYFFSSRIVSGTNRSFISEIVANNDYLLDAIKLLKYFYLLSLESINFSKEMQVINQHRPSLVLPLYNELKKDFGMTLYPVINDILGFINSMDESIELELYGYCCFAIQGNKYQADISKIIQKYQLLLDLDSQKLEKEKLIIKLCDSDYYSESIKNAIIAKGDEYINNLSSSILAKIITVFTEETKDSYKNNYPFLLLILNNGIQAQKRTITNLLIDKIHNRKDISEVLKICEQGKFDKKMRNEIISSLDSFVEETENITDDVKERIEKLKK